MDPLFNPVFCIGVRFCLFNGLARKVNVGAMGPQWDFSFWDRFLIAGRALWFYIGKSIWPSPIIFTYPRWQIDDSVWWQYVYPLSFVVFLIVHWVLRKKIGRGPLAGILIFAGSLFPALGFLMFIPCGTPLWQTIFSILRVSGSSSCSPVGWLLWQSTGILNSIKY